jgi:hypothetical protein
MIILIKGRQGGKVLLVLCTWNALLDSAMVHIIPLLPTSRVGGGLVELVGVNDALSCSLLTRDELLETLLICPLALLPAAAFALPAAGSPCSSPASCRLITRHSA